MEMETDSSKLVINDLLEKPLSPVLSNSRSVRNLFKRKLQRKNSRVKLLNKFETSNENTALNTQTSVCKSPISIEDSLTASQTDSLIDVLEQIGNLNKPVQDTLPQSSRNIDDDFNFKVPQLQNRQESFQSKNDETGNLDMFPKKSSSITFNDSKNLFQTAAGKDILLSNEAMKKSCLLFNDIVNSSNLSPQKTKKHSFLTKSDSNNRLEEFNNSNNSHNVQIDSKQEQVKFNGFQTASGKQMVISESALQTAKNKFFLEATEICEKPSISFTQEIKNSGLSDTQISSVADDILEGISDLVEIENGTELIESDEIDIFFTENTIIENEFCKRENIEDKNEEKFKGFSQKEVNDSNNVCLNLEKILTLFNSSEIQNKDLSKINKRPLIESTNVQPFKKLKCYENFFDMEDANFIESSTEKIQQIQDNIVVKEEKNRDFNFVGFQTASGSAMKISEKSLQKAQNLFMNVDTDINNSGTYNNIKPISKSNILSNKLVNGFQTAGGNALNISEKALQKVENLFKNVDTHLNFTKFSDNVTGFKAETSDSKVQKKTENLLDKQNFKDTFKEQIEDNKSTQTPVGGFHLNGFKTVSGKNVKYSENAFHKAKNLFKNLETTENEQDKLFSDFQQEAADLFKDSDSKVTLKAENELTKETPNSTLKNLEISSRIKTENSEHQSVQPKFHTPIKKADVSENDQIVNKACSSNTLKSQNKKRLTPFTPKQIPVSSEQLKKARLLLDENNKTPAKNEVSMYNSTPIRRSPFKNENKSTFLLNSTITPIKLSNLEETIKNCEAKENLYISLKQPTPGEVVHWISNLDKEKEILERKLKLITDKRTVLKRQQYLSETIIHERRSKRLGLLSIQKAQHSRTPLRTLTINTSQDVENFLTGITPQNAKYIHFKVENNTSITTFDGAVIVPNLENLIGLSEIKVAFNVMPGVDMKLIPSGWIENHFKWIIWKLASYDRLFSSNLNECLNIENIIQQLKYRYDREIDKAERSALRKIYETDDVPQKRMVLCVSNIIQINNNDGYQLELCDGWYSIRTVIDEPLCYQIKKGKINIGTKLVICGAEIINCSGCHPLEGSNSVNLKISYNSTRRAIWYAKLGYQKISQPYPVKIYSILASGGIIGCIKVFVAKIYPLKYMEKDESNNIVWRNKKAEEKRIQEWEKERCKKIEEIHEKMKQDLEKSQINQKINIKITNYNKNDIKNIDCPEILYNLYEKSNDPESFHELLSVSQKSMMMNYQHNLSNKKHQEMSFRISEQIQECKFNERNVTPVLTLLILDAYNMNDNKCYNFNIWKPTNSHMECLKEGTVVNIYNTVQKTNGDLSSVNKTKFYPSTEIYRNCEKYIRKFICVDEIYKLSNVLLNNEFDTVGIVVDFASNTSNQHLWLSDLNKCLLLIKINIGYNFCSLLDNLKNGQIVSVSNIKTLNRNQDFSVASGNYFTLISSYPRANYLQKEIENLNQHLPKNIGKFVEECNNKIANYSEPNLKPDVSGVSVLDDSGDESVLSTLKITSTDVAMSLIDIDKFQ